MNKQFLLFFKGTTVLTFCLIVLRFYCCFLCDSLVSQTKHGSQCVTDVGTHGLLMLSRRREFQSYFNILLAKHITRKWYQAIVTTNAWEQFLTKYGFNKNNVGMFQKTKNKISLDLNEKTWFQILEFPIILKHWMAEIREDEDEQISHFIPSYKTIHKGLRPWPPIGSLQINWILSLSFSFTHSLSLSSLFCQYASALSFCFLSSIYWMSTL